MEWSAEMFMVKIIQFFTLLKDPPHRIPVAPIFISFLFPLFLLYPVTSTRGAGFIGPGAISPVTTAAEALKAEDDVPCVLEGKIEAKIPARKNRYLFSDQSGKIVVEIKKKVFENYTVTPETRVRLEGEVEWSSKHPNEVEVEHLEIVN